MKSIPPVVLKLVSVVLVLLMVVLPAHADSGSSTPTPVSVSTTLVKDPAQIAEIANTLRKSDALMATFENAPSEEVTTQWLETFASTSRLSAPRMTDNPRWRWLTAHPGANPKRSPAAGAGKRVWPSGPGGPERTSSVLVPQVLLESFPAPAA